MVAAEAGDLYRRLQQRAKEEVSRVAKLSAVPRTAWSSPDPGTVMVRAGQAESWAVMVAATDTFAQVHRCGVVLRRAGGMGPSALPPGGAPEPLCWEYRRWNLALSKLPELRRLPAALRLRAAHEWGLEPGLWATGDLSAAPEQAKPRRLLGGLLVSPR
jgi:hypothetical protein